MKYIALDIGSSSIKGTVRDLERLQMASQVIRAPCPDPVNGLAPHNCELDPLKVAESVQ